MLRANGIAPPAPAEDSRKRAASLTDGSHEVLDLTAESDSENERRIKALRVCSMFCYISGSSWIFHRTNSQAWNGNVAKQRVSNEKKEVLRPVVQARLYRLRLWIWHEVASGYALLFLFGFPIVVLIVYHLMQPYVFWKIVVLRPVIDTWSFFQYCQLNSPSSVISDWLVWSSYEGYRRQVSGNFLPEVDVNRRFPWWFPWCIESETGRLRTPNSDSLKSTSSFSLWNTSTVDCRNIVALHIFLCSSKLWA